MQKTMTALRSCERQSDGCFPTTQTLSGQESEKLFGGVPFRSPVPAGDRSYFCQPRLYQDLLNYLQYNAFLRYVKHKNAKFVKIFLFLKMKTNF